ncbi:hypothetical protein TRVL_08231 [Trypanosoma vivax]|uniref:Uncharacterized protein n=1 Tax=Trypanosoma vivax (strain Y486) TaxID=1055687 RepID=F9WMU5_TRYVY|nr:hypothetical protein TRVL_08231 [Trypanosoma vivax]CCD18860.1 hypothetical protein, conserved in T. vivax [Trypanosoma vivax Y486]|eukprot:CCD18860.1 hypothetical protein, conserved in T. vivax [Trypanosoma vivax Y486]
MTRKRKRVTIVRIKQHRHTPEKEATAFCDIQSLPRPTERKKKKTTQQHRAQDTARRQCKSETQKEKHSATQQKCGEAKQHKDIEHIERLRCHHAQFAHKAAGRAHRQEDTKEKTTKGQQSQKNGSAGHAQRRNREYNVLEKRASAHRRKRNKDSAKSGKRKETTEKLPWKVARKQGKAWLSGPR